MDSFMELAQERYSVRSYEDRPVEQEKLDLILEAARIAPSTANHQSTRVYVARSEEALAVVRRATTNHYGARTVLVFTYSRDEECHKHYQDDYTTGPQDASIAATHAMLEAWDLGVGSCWVNFYDPAVIREGLGIPAREVPVLLLLLGYASESAKPASLHAKKKSIAELVAYR